MSIFGASGRYVFSTIGNEANIIIQYYLVPRCFSTNPKIHDLEWTFYVKLCFAPVCLEL